MSNSPPSTEPTALTDQQFNRRVIDVAIKLSAIALIIFWCFQIIKPFVLIVIWGAIMAVALYPLHSKLTGFLIGNQTSPCIIIALVGISLIALPAITWRLSCYCDVQLTYYSA